MDEKDDDQEPLETISDAAAAAAYAVLVGAERWDRVSTIKAALRAAAGACGPEGDSRG